MSTHPANAPPREAFADAIQRIEALNRDLLSERMELLRRCKPIHEDIRSVIDEAKENGIRTKVLKREIKRRDHLRKADQVVDGLTNDEDEAQWDYLRRIFGDDAELALFAAAADAHAEFAKGEAETNVTPIKRKRKTAAEVAAEKNAELASISSE